MEGKERVQDFINILQETSQEESCELMKSFVVDAELVEEIINVIECNHASQICDSVCEVLFKLNSSCEDKCTTFCLQFVPAVIWAYYSLISRQVKWSSSKVETILLSIYNQVVNTNSDATFCKSFRIPVLSKPSIYHESTMGVASMLTEHGMSQHEKADKPILLRSATKLLDRIPAGFRSSVMKATLTKYNEFLSCYFEPSLKCFCRMVIRLSVCGFPFASDDNEFISVESLKLLQNYPKVLLNGEVTKEMVTSLHFIAFNGSAQIAVAALQYLHKKSCYSICPAAVLATNAAQDLMKLSDEADSFEHTPPLNPYISTYRGVANLSSLQKLMKEAVTPTKTQHPVDSISTLLSETSSPRSGETPNIIGCLINSALTPIAPVTAIDNVMYSPNVCNETVETNVSDFANFSVGSDGEDNNLDDTCIELTSLQKTAPKIVIDMHDVSDEVSSDDMPLIDHSEKTAASVSDVSLSETTQTYTFSPLENEVQSEIQTNTDSTTDNNVYDTQF